jgi:hypothetical protein
VAPPPRKQHSPKYRMLEFSLVWTLLNWRTCRTVEVTVKILLTASLRTIAHRRIYRPRQLNHKGFIQGTQVFTCIRNTSITHPQVSDPLLQASHIALNYTDFWIILNRQNYHAQQRGCLLFSATKSHTFLEKTYNIPSPTMNKISLISEFSLSLNWKFSNKLAL